MCVASYLPHVASQVYFRALKKIIFDGSSLNIFLLANSFIYSLAHSVSLKR